MADGSSIEWTNATWNSLAMPAGEKARTGPPVIEALIRDAIDTYRDVEAWDVTVERQTAERPQLEALADRWGNIQGILRDAS